MEMKLYNIISWLILSHLQYGRTTGDLLCGGEGGRGCFQAGLTGSLDNKGS